MKKLLSFALLLMLTLVVAACGGKEESGGESKDEATLPSQLVIATGGTSGTYYPLGGGIAQIITDNTEVTATAQTSGGSVENMRLLGQKEVELAFVQNDIAEYASKGTFMFEGSKVENLQGLATLYNETVQIVVPADSSISTVADLAGKRVSVGAPGSGVEANALQVLEIYGLTFDDLKSEHLSFGDSVSKIQDGNLDAAFVTAGAPTSAVTELSATKGVKLISLEQEKIDELIAKYPFYVQDTIPAGTYPGADAETVTVAVKAMLAVSKDLPEQFVYDITKLLFEKNSELVAINKKAESITKENAVEGLSLEIHPGALKFYKENGLK